MTVTVACRFLVLVAFAFWQGGFTFYTAIVVPIGTDVLGSPLAQGMITRQVAHWINVSGAVALAIMAIESALTRPWRTSRMSILFLQVLILVTLFVLFYRLDSYIDPGASIVHERTTFHGLHRVYLWLSTVQWACSVVWLGLTIAAWRRSDRG